MLPQKECSMVLVEPRKMELRKFPVPQIGPDEFLLKVNLVTICGDDLADVVVECTGAAPMMEMALDIVRPAGRYVMIGTCGYNKTPLTTDKIVFKEITVRGGLGQSWDTEPAVKIINSRKYAIEKMITDVFPLEKSQEAIEYFMKSPDKALRVAIRPE